MIYNKLLHQEFQFLTLLKANGVFFLLEFFFSLIKIVALFYFYNF